ncbi:MAG: hydroxymyristoyl-ACP dehydratase [Pseudomonadota bacterium]
MSLSRDQIAALLPHGNGMCMLDEVISWDAEQIHCRSQNFARTTNPLFENGQLANIMLIEFAAQAAGVHAALLHPAREGLPRAAYIGAVKNVELLKPVSDNAVAIELKAHCLLNNSSGAIYEVIAQQQDAILMRGRLILNQI